MSPAFLSMIAGERGRARPQLPGGRSLHDTTFFPQLQVKLSCYSRVHLVIISVTRVAVRRIGGRKGARDGVRRIGTVTRTARLIFDIVFFESCDDDRIGVKDAMNG